MSYYQVCSRCVMDTTASDIYFDEQGICNFCTTFLKSFSAKMSQSPALLESEKNQFIQKVKAKGKDKPYDCLMGVSGGVDSSWAVYLAVKHGLRPLVVHMDNGWNSELAQNNIENLVKKLGLDLYTHVINWDEYRELMQAFFNADVIDIELLYDNAMLGVNYEQASKFGLNYILAGTNMATEGLAMPKTWSWLKFDKKNILSIWQTLGQGGPLKTFPAIGSVRYAYLEYIKRTKWISFLDYFDYKKSIALDTLSHEIGYRPYPYKHYESVFTRFYQGYLLPKKFNVDKRRVHLSTLIISGQLSRQEALENLQSIPYPTEQALADDIDYFLKKMKWSKQDLETYLKRPPKPHNYYGTEIHLWNQIHHSYYQLKKLLKINQKSICYE